MTNHTQSFVSKLPQTPISIFSKMTQLAQVHGAVNLSQGFPDFDVDPHLVDLVTQKMSMGFNQYAPMPGALALRERIAKKYAGINQLSLDPEQEITITAGGTQGLFTAIGTLIRPGDEAIIFEPAYDSYRPSIEVYGGKVVAVELLAPLFAIDWEIVRSKVTNKTKLIVINNPNNPTGTILSKADIQALEQLVVDYGLYVISDEVYEHIIFEGRHESVLHSEVLRQRSFVVASFGKLLHATGWKVGYVVAAPFLTGEFRKIHQFNVFSVNTPMQLAIADYLAEDSYYIGLSSFFKEKRDYVGQALQASGFKVLPCAGTYFMLLDYSAISEQDELDFAVTVTEQYKLATIPISSFYTSSRNQNILRICFAKKEETLNRAVSILLQI